MLDGFVFKDETHIAHGRCFPVAPLEHVFSLCQDGRRGPGGAFSEAEKTVRAVSGRF